MLKLPLKAETQNHLQEYYNCIIDADNNIIIADIEADVEKLKEIVNIVNSKNPLETIDISYVNKLGKCPVCKNIISPFKVKYCSDCGQKLKWE